MKQFSSTIAFLFLVGIVYSQSDTVYLNLDGQVTMREFASIYRVCDYDTATGFPVGGFTDYQVGSGSVVAEGNYTEKGKEGVFTMYFLDGKPNQVVTYKDNKPEGKWTYFYGTGDTAYVLDVVQDEIKILFCKDTSLSEVIVDGEGSFQKIFGDAFIEGNVKDNLMSGTWTVTFPAGKLVEKYSKGQFKSGKEKGQSYGYPDPRIKGFLLENHHFTVIEELKVSNLYRQRDYPRLHNMFSPRWQAHAQDGPTGSFYIVEDRGGFPGGMEYLSEYIVSRYEYPKEAQENKIVGKVIVEFTVDIDGQVKNPVILQSLGYGCDEVVLEMVENMPDWIPGQQRGKLVAMQYKLPVPFGD